jgi:hypothetical protein
MQGKEGFNITSAGNTNKTKTNQNHKPAWHLASTVRAYCENHQLEYVKSKMINFEKTV